MNVHVKDANGTPLNAKLVIACLRDSNNQLGYVAGVSKPGTQLDDVKIGSADGETSDVVMPLEWHLERSRDVEGTVAFDPENEGFVICPCSAVVHEFLSTLFQKVHTCCNG